MYKREFGMSTYKLRLVDFHTETAVLIAVLLLAKIRLTKTRFTLLP